MVDERLRVPMSRRRLLDRAVQMSTLTVASALGVPRPSTAAPARPPFSRVTPSSFVTPGPGVPAYMVHDLVPGAPADAVALTIDDGPDPLWTPAMLALLARYRVRATFSLIGASARARPDLVRRIVGAGHGVCNHSMTHPQSFAALPVAAGRSQILDAQEVITDAAGVAPRLFRAPGGSWSPAVLSTLASLQMRPLAWNIDPRDWSRPGTAAVTSRLSAAKPGDILLCHDGGGDRAETLAALGTVLPRLTDRGLRFVTL